jgi:hypothetical protein
MKFSQHNNWHNSEAFYFPKVTFRPIHITNNINTMLNFPALAALIIPIVNLDFTCPVNHTSQVLANSSFLFGPMIVNDVDRFKWKWRFWASLEIYNWMKNTFTWQNFLYAVSGATQIGNVGGTAMVVSWHLLPSLVTLQFILFEIEQFSVTFLSWLQQRKKTNYRVEKSLSVELTLDDIHSYVSR